MKSKFKKIKIEFKIDSENTRNNDCECLCKATYIIIPIESRNHMFFKKIMITNLSLFNLKDCRRLYIQAETECQNHYEKMLLNNYELSTL